MSILTGDNPFYRQPEQLEEGAVAGNVRKRLNELQEYWNQNAEEFLSGSQPLFPIMGRPFTTAKRNGLLVLGINHPMQSTHRKVAEMFVAARKNGQLPVYDRNNGGWHIHWGLSKDSMIQKDRQIVNNEKNVLDRYLNLEDKVLDFTDLSDDYYDSYIKTMKIFKREDLFKETHFAELVPYASLGEGAINTHSDKHKLFERCMYWFESYIYLCQPKLIICNSNSVSNTMKTFFGSKQIDSFSANIKGKNLNLADAYELGGNASGTLVLNIYHLTGSRGSEKSKYDHDAIREMLNSLWASKDGGSKHRLSPAEIKHMTIKDFERLNFTQKEVMNKSDAEKEMAKAFIKFEHPKKKEITKYKESIVKDIMYGLSPEESFLRHLK